MTPKEFNDLKLKKAVTNNPFNLKHIILDLVYVFTIYHMHIYIFLKRHNKNNIKIILFEFIVRGLINQYASDDTVT